MRFREFFPVAAACLSLQGCLEVETRPRPDLEEPPDLSQPDLAPPCAAASGLPGDNLLCVDFSAIPEGSLGTSLPAKLYRLGLCEPSARLAGRSRAASCKWSTSRAS
jgi:hypothetical protein